MEPMAFWLLLLTYTTNTQCPYLDGDYSCHLTKTNISYSMTVDQNADFIRIDNSPKYIIGGTSTHDGLVVKTTCKKGQKIFLDMEFDRKDVSRMVVSKTIKGLNVRTDGELKMTCTQVTYQQTAKK